VCPDERRNRRVSALRSFLGADRSECRVLLERHTVGRVSWQAQDGPSILPVTYAFRENTIYFRTSAYGELSGLAAWHSRVAFEVDGVDEASGTGWNVLVRGSAKPVPPSYTLTSLWTDGPVPRASGHRTLFIAITPTSTSGRGVQAPD
jgi:hypothetical protein